MFNSHLARVLPGDRFSTSTAVLLQLRRCPHVFLEVGCLRHLLNSNFGSVISRACVFQNSARPCLPNSESSMFNINRLKKHSFEKVETVSTYFSNVGIQEKIQ